MLRLADGMAVAARDRRPVEWSLFCRLAGPTGEMPSEAAGLHRLRMACSLKVWEAADFNAFAVATLGCRLSASTPGEAERIRAAQEANRLEELFRADFIAEAAAGRWEAIGVDARTGREVTVPRSIWLITALRLDLEKDEIDPGTAPKLIGVRVRPVQSAEQAAPVTEPVALISQPGRPTPTRKRGRRGEKGQRVEAQMRAELESGKLTPDQLHDIPEKELRHLYGESYGIKSRDTVRKARDRIFSDTEFINKCRQ
jgi:hypothetical protein